MSKRLIVPKGFVLIRLDESTDCSIEVVQAMFGISRERALAVTTLDSYQPVKGQVPILIGSDGDSHQKSAILTEKVSPLYGGDITKACIDGHADYCLLTGVLYSGNHNRYVVENRLIQELLVGGINPEWLDAEEITDILEGIEKCRLSTKLNILHQLEGRRLHVSCDLDVIRGATYTRGYKREDGPTITDVATTLEVLAKNNTIVAFDIFGINVYFSNDAFSQGICHYRKLYRKITGT